jgi:signal transduction histidine kinase
LIPVDPRIHEYREALEKLARGKTKIQVHPGLLDEVGCLGEMIQELAVSIEKNNNFNDRLNDITDQINAGLTLEEVMERVYENFASLIPYKRIGFSLIDPERRVARARWAKSDFPEMKITGGYELPLAGSSLEMILESGQPRIINDLEKYLEMKPGSESTRLIVEEGVRSSLTCPLVVRGKPVGFIFFSSDQPDTYQDEHIDIFLRLAKRLSVIVEKSSLVSQLADQKKAIEQQNEELKRLNGVKNTFIGIAAHDLRNPISNLRLGMEILTETQTWQGEMDREEFLALYMDTVDRQTSHMLSLLNDLLDISQIESGRLSLKLESIDAAPFLEEILRPHVQAALIKNISVSLDPRPVGKLVGDPMRLRQVLDNLVSNAVKYSPERSCVRVWAVEYDNEWRFYVQDQGPGVTDEDRRKLFQDFARGSARPTGGEKSTGLGLAISKRVVEAHGGKIGVDAAPEGGSVFWFTIPC